LRNDGTNTARLERRHERRVDDNVSRRERVRRHPQDWQSREAPNDVRHRPCGCAHRLATAETRHYLQLVQHLHMCTTMCRVNTFIVVCLRLPPAARAKIDGQNAGAARNRATDSTLALAAAHNERSKPNAAAANAGLACLQARRLLNVCTNTQVCLILTVIHRFVRQWFVMRRQDYDDRVICSLSLLSSSVWQVSLSMMQCRQARRHPSLVAN
jgi:hypothetical protein